MKIGILTGGGDCPGLNAVIRAVVRKGVFTYGDEFVGFLEGWRGLVDDTAWFSISRPSAEFSLAAEPSFALLVPIPRSARMASTDVWPHWRNIRSTPSLRSAVDDTLSVAQKL